MRVILQYTSDLTAVMHNVIFPFKVFFQTLQYVYMLTPSFKWWFLDFSVQCQRCFGSCAGKRGSTSPPNMTTLTRAQQGLRRRCWGRGGIRPRSALKKAFDYVWNISRARLRLAEQSLEGLVSSQPTPRTWHRAHTKDSDGLPVVVPEMISDMFPWGVRTSG